MTSYWERLNVPINVTLKRVTKWRHTQLYSYLKTLNNLQIFIKPVIYIFRPQKIQISINYIFGSFFICSPFFNRTVIESQLYCIVNARIKHPYIYRRLEFFLFTRFNSHCTVITRLYSCTFCRRGRFFSAFPLLFYKYNTMIYLCVFNLNW